MYAVVFSDRALEDLRALPKPVQRQIVRKLERARTDPARFFRRLQGMRAHRLRVGDDRVLAQIDARAKTIGVAHIGHRRNVYR